MWSLGPHLGGPDCRDIQPIKNLLDYKLPAENKEKGEKIASKT